METEHNITLGYTYMDDGVWLNCSCGWKHNLEFFVSPEEALSQAETHRIEVLEQQSKLEGVK